MSLTLTVDVTVATPPYEQLRTQIAGYIRSGQLRGGDRLPVGRVLAADLGIAANTVARAYRELEAEGLVTGRRRTGTVVRDGVGSTASRALRDAAQHFVAAARAEGWADNAIIELLRGTLQGEGLDHPSG
mgnify:CR=1 FL=1